ncbi:cysteine proteinase inhibitor 1-like [Primulina tabacum]|uniref:cysteine proteinase inhibitor 1-like n=1 Tax=Primulina tabacum TaxID=48773 RepID=UPI003F597BBC
MVWIVIKFFLYDVGTCSRYLSINTEKNPGLAQQYANHVSQINHTGKALSDKLVREVPSLATGKPIPNVNVPEVLEIARFAVSEHNKKANVQLEFVKAVKGETQVVEGTNYRLVIIANDKAAGNAPGNYEAVVWDMPWKHFRELSSFVKV